MVKHPARRSLISVYLKYSELQKLKRIGKSIPLDEIPIIWHNKRTASRREKFLPYGVIIKWLINNYKN